VRTIAAREINAATDNPLFFGRQHSWDLEFRDNWQRRAAKRLSASLDESLYDGSKRRSYSAGNFHGQPCALAADVLAIALAEFANISERRTQLLMDGDHNRGLPGNLIPDAGLNSGFMIAQYCAAALVSENKVLAHPASVDSIPTSSNSEDHNSMATIAARKLRTVLANARHALAIELLVAAQAIEWATLFDGIKAGTLPGEIAKLAATYIALRNDVEPDLKNSKAPKTSEKENPIERRNRLWQRGDIERTLFARWTDARNRALVRTSLGMGTGEAYVMIRSHVRPMLRDRVLADDIRRVASLIAPQAEVRAELVQAVEDRTGGSPNERRKRRS
jgi:histidine ammonia-lyase